MKKITSLFFIIITVSAVFAQNSISKFKQFKLDNGLTVILNEDHTNPEVFGAVVCKAGGKNDPDDATGMAHYQEHMLFKGTQTLGTTDWEKEKVYIDKIFKLYDELGKTEDEEKRKEIQKEINENSLKANEYAIPNELSNLIKSMGGTKLNAGTGRDKTVYYNAFPPNQIEKWIELYSHRFINPVFRGFQSELEVVYEEKNMYSDIFFYPILEKFNMHFFKNHPYGQQTLVGTTDDLKNPSLTKMYDFFKTYYVANNMALIITGDFQSEKIIPMIKEKFGQLKSGKIPETKKYDEKPFEGREFYEYRLSPIKLALFGFRTVPLGHEDAIVIDICNSMLTNINRTGLIDKLVDDNKLLTTQAFSMTYSDHGAGVFLVIPKIVGQSLENAEELVMQQVEKLKKGEFDDALFQTVKNQLYVRFQRSFESIEGRALKLADAFYLDKSPETLYEYPEKVKAVTKEDVIKAANKYFGKNYLAFYSKMGKNKPEKIEKPGYKPVVSNTNAKSEFSKEFDKINSSDYKMKYIDFEKDIKQTIISNDVNLFYNENPINDIFSLNIIFKAGKHTFNITDYVSQIMNYCGAGDYSSEQLKEEFGKIGCTWSVSNSYNSFTINISGIESNIQRALELINLIINKPTVEQSKIQIITENEKTSRKMESSEPDNVADALFDYVRYGEKSDYIDRLTIDEIKDLQAIDLVNRFKEITQYETEIHYTGKFGFENFKKEIDSKVNFGEKKHIQSKLVNKEIKKYSENTVFVVDKKASQSKIYFLINGDVFNKEEQAVINAFNIYFGGDFSGLVLQEIREYRSLAYTAGAAYRTPPIKEANNYFAGYIGTQADKTIEALETFHNLVRKMPEKRDRMQMIKDYLTLSEITKQPGFRSLSEHIQAWKRLSYESDPAKNKMPAYEKMTFDDILNFYKKNIKEKPLVIAFVGNTKKIDMKKLEKYGKIIEIKEKELFKK